MGSVPEFLFAMLCALAALAVVWGVLWLSEQGAKKEMREGVNGPPTFPKPAPPPNPPQPKCCCCKEKMNVR